VNTGVKGLKFRNGGTQLFEMCVCHLPASEVSVTNLLIGCPRDETGAQ